jgi:NADH:ubiquinone oxidoreductase subunit B-like Fe-S oxidoreductase
LHNTTAAKQQWRLHAQLACCSIQGMHWGTVVTDLQRLLLLSSLLLLLLLLLRGTLSGVTHCKHLQSVSS